jgi:hypothetical protein
MIFGLLRGALQCAGPDQNPKNNPMQSSVDRIRIYLMSLAPFGQIKARIENIFMPKIKLRP